MIPADPEQQTKPIACACCGQEEPRLLAVLGARSETDKYFVVVRMYRHGTRRHNEERLSSLMELSERRAPLSELLSVDGRQAMPVDGVWASHIAKVGISHVRCCRSRQRSSKKTGILWSFPCLFEILSGRAGTIAVLVKPPQYSSGAHRTRPLLACRARYHHLGLLSAFEG